MYLLNCKLIIKTFDKEELLNEIDEFRKDKEISALCYNQRYDGNIIKDYENKKLGTIGELYVSEQMKNLINVYVIILEFFISSFK